MWFPTVAVAISSADVTLQFDFLHLAFLTLLEFVILVAAKKSSLAKGTFKQLVEQPFLFNLYCVVIAIKQGWKNISVTRDITCYFCSLPSTIPG